MDYEPHQQRVVDEKAALDEKYEKLKSFLCRDDFRLVVADDKERERLYRQSLIMAEYSVVLGERIEAFQR